MMEIRNFKILPGRLPGKTRLRNFLMCCLLIMSGSTMAQSTLKYSSTAVPLTPGTTTLNFPIRYELDKKKIINAAFKVHFDLGDQYLFAKLGENFDLSVSFTLAAFDNNNPVSVFNGSTHTLNIKNDQPEAAFIIDIDDFTNTVDFNENFTFDKIKLTLTAVPNTAGVNQAVVEAIRMRMAYEIEYGFDIDDPLNQYNLTVQAVDIDGRLATFRWNDNYPVEIYEFQLLRLYNEQELQPGVVADEQDITTAIDFSKALSVEAICDLGAQPGDKSLSFTLAEGQGFYVFRIRPVGNYYGNGVGDSRNLGNWSYTPSEPEKQSKNVPISEPLPYFYFTDPDDDKNWIYSRIFTEESRVKETMTYANQLQQVRQLQTYLPSQDVTLVTQTVLDNSGRPALTTIPVPLDGRRANYQKGFMQASGGGIYQSKDFDTDANALNPAQVDEGTQGFNYYKDGPANVPQAEGYPYTRTRYYNDGSNRVVEQSGVGAQHRMGQHTTRYFYGSPSDQELTAIFGSEAPASDDVFKTITVDPNNIASVTYTSKEGNVIATSLAFYGEDPGTLADLEPRVQGKLETTITDKLKQGAKTENGLVSFKRFVILQQSPFSLQYNIPCEQVETLCNVVDINCNHKLTISLMELDANGLFVQKQALIETDLGPEQCVAGVITITLPANLTLDPGTYILQKKIELQETSLQIKERTEAIRGQVDPLANMIRDWLNRVSTFQQLENFYNTIEELGTAINSEDLENFTASGASDPEGLFPMTIPASFFSNEIYNKPLPNGMRLSSEFSVSVSPDLILTLKTPCCEIDIDIDWEPPIDCSSPGGFDFEAYALSFLGECDISAVEVKNKFYNDYMIGYPEGTFNAMAEQMLAEGDPDYTCEKLSEAWTTIVGLIKSSWCHGFDISFDGSNTDISEVYDGNQDAEGDNPNDEFNTLFDDVDLKGTFFLIRWIAKRKISRRIRDLTKPGNIDIDPDDAVLPVYAFHPVKEFLGAVSIRFEKILHPFDAVPIDENADASFAYTIVNHIGENAPYPKVMNRMVNGANPADLTYYLNNSTNPSSAVGARYYYPLDPSVWQPEDQYGNIIFPFIRNPVFAYKYYEYPKPYTTPEIEFSTCFADPNHCYEFEQKQVMIEGVLQNRDFFKLVNGNGDIIPTICCQDPMGAIDDFCLESTDYYESMALVDLDPIQQVGTVDANNDGIADFKRIVREFCDVGTVKCGSTHVNWNTGQNATFYKLLTSTFSPKDWVEEFKEELPAPITCNYLTDYQEWYKRGDGITGVEEFIGVNYFENDLPQSTREALRPSYEPRNTVWFSWVGEEITKIKNACTQKCAGRAPEFRQAILDLLRAKCYEIGDCPGDDKVVPMAHVELMVQQLVTACQGQCDLDTFGCQDDLKCRNPYDSPFIFDRSTATRIVLGVAGHPGGSNVEICDPGNTDPPITFADNNAGYYVPVDVDDNGVDPNDPKKYSFTALLANEQYSYYQYTLINQAANWNFELDIVSKCTDPDPNPFDCCAGQTIANQSTFIRRDKYERGVNDFDPDNPGGEVVNSPKKTIEVDPHAGGGN